MPENHFVAEPRTEFGKGAARRVRRANKVPAVLYGHGEKPRHISLPGHELALALRGDGNVLLSLEFEGATELALPRAIVRDPIKGFLEHVDLLIVKRGERVTVELALSIVGDAAPGVLPQQQLQAVSVEAEATNLPESIEIDVTGMEAGTTVTAADVKLPEGTTLVTDAEAIVISASLAPVAVSAEDEAAAAGESAAAADAAPAEGAAPAEA